LWRRAFEAEATPAENDSLNLLKATYATFRDRAAALTAQIGKTLPNLTIHDVTHLDALWETADLIAGDEYPLNPAEAFVFGGAILLHDAALCFEAYSGGQAGLRELVEWKDAIAAIDARDTSSIVDQKWDEADFATMRILHAQRAAELGSASWTDPDGDKFYLIESVELRRHYGTLIGQIAASHHWPIEDVSSKLPPQLNALSSMPRDWRVDPVKLACLLRCADAAHIDNRRAPDFLRALTKLHGVSADHWTAQNWLERADRDTADAQGRSLIFTSGKAFTEANAQAWWVAFEAIRLVDRELSASADLLEKRPQAKQSPPFQMQRVTGASSPEIAKQIIPTSGWSPKAVEIHVSNLERLVSQLGGTKLYGESQLPIIVLRELIQNARDAVAARRAIDKNYVGCIKVYVSGSEDQYSFVVEDDGIGMSERVMTGPLLDFGSSFWASDLARSEFPGLLSSGYRSVGQFGIGFYSIFMVAASVSVASRRFDKGLEDVTQLRFPNGLSLRPLISSGAPATFPFGASTRVEFVVKQEFGDLSQILIKAGRQGYEPEVRLPLAQCLSILCAGLDTRIELVEHDEIPRLVHRPPQELDTVEKREAWFFDIARNNNSHTETQSIRESAARLRFIVEGTRICGLAALSVTRDPSAARLGHISTVGGLATMIAMSDGSRYVGYIDYKPSSAKRDTSGGTVASAEAIQAWATEQKALLPSRASDPLKWCFATCSLADLNCDPYDVVTAVVLRGGQYQFATLDQLVMHVCEEGLAFYRSHLIPHVEVHHSLGGVRNIPTFWPIANSAFLSLKRDESGVADPNSVLSCIERRATELGIRIEETCEKAAAKSYFGLMDIIILKGYRLFQSGR
jgi:hypothetical protein